jgi:hypothetical protein
MSSMPNLPACPPRRSLTPRPSAALALAAVGLGFGCDRGGAAFTPLDGPPPDAPVDAPVDAPEVVGSDYSFVVSRLRLPGSVNEATLLGLDIDDVPGDTMNGIDNSLGTVLATFTGQGLGWQPAIDSGIDRGVVLSLPRLRATDLGDADGVGLWLHRGQSSAPAACDGPADTTCRKHLTGTASFELAFGSSLDEPLVGTLRRGRFVGGPGRIRLFLTLSAGRAPVELPLYRTRAEVIVTSSGFAVGSKVGGAVRQVDLEASLHPAVRDQVFDVVAVDCGPPPRTPPACGCMSGSLGATLMNLMDTSSPRDCAVSLSEVTAFLNPIINQDIDLDGDGSKDAVSLGVGLEAVSASFAAP